MDALFPCDINHNGEIIDMLQQKFKTWMYLKKVSTLCINTIYLNLLLFFQWPGRNPPLIAFLFSSSYDSFKLSWIISHKHHSLFIRQEHPHLLSEIDIFRKPMWMSHFVVQHTGWLIKKFIFKIENCKFLSGYNF